VIGYVNRSGKPVLSVDIASGVHGDTGLVLGAAVRADCTVTFGLPKLGNLLYPGHEMCGRLLVSHISFPPNLHATDSINISTSDPVRLPPRKIGGHKGDFGDALFISGASSYFGAPYYAAMSYMRAGGGYARLAAPATIVPTIAGKGSEIVFVPQVETPEGSISVENADDLLHLIEKLDFVVLGPGLSLQGETQKLVRKLVGAIEKPLLLDGDGITAVCGQKDLVRQRRAPTILTPHMGEMSRLTGRAVTEIEADKVGILQAVCSAQNAVVVLKGAHSLIGYPDGRVYINLSGNDGMATAGSGDVLTGTIAAMVGLGLSVDDAVRQGVFAHGLAGDLAAESEGPDGMTAQSILEHVGPAVRQCREDRRGILKRYSLPVIV
jgi:NAD(P)H-hydrate epimerase